MTVLHTPAFWYGLIAGIILTLTAALACLGYILKRINQDESPEDDRATCPSPERCPAYIPEAKGQRCTEASECSREASEDDRPPPYDSAA